MILKLSLVIFFKQCISFIILDFSEQMWLKINKFKIYYDEEIVARILKFWLV